MEQRISWDVEDVNTGCNDLGSLLGNMKRSSTSIESDMDSGYQDVCLDNHSVTPAMSKSSQEESDNHSIDKDTNLESVSLKLSTKDPWSYEELMRRGEWLKSLGNFELPQNWNQLEITERMEIVENIYCELFPNLPKSLIVHSFASLFPSDSGKLPSEVPDWLDKEKFFRGQRFAQDNTFGIMYANCISLYVLYSFEDGLRPIILTGRSSNPYTSFKRFLSTANRVRNWFTSDPWTEGTPAYNDIRAVKRLHESVRNKLEALSLSQLDEITKIDKPLAVRRELLLEDFKAACPVARLGQCPYVMPEVRKNRPKGLNQGEMSLTTFGFIGLLILHPEAFGIHNATDEDLDAFCHLWRSLTYLLGVSDE